MTNFYHKREELKALGMTLIAARAETDEPAREYWGFTDCANKWGDHSATITHVGGGEWVSHIGK